MLRILEVQLILTVTRILFHYSGRQLFIPAKKKLRKYIQKIFTAENVKLKRVDYIFCSDGFLLKMNQKFLKHNYYTDILTFNLSETDKEITGEIYISLDRVKDNTRINSTTFKKEILRVIFHGALHLCGYNDKTKKQLKKMREKEEYYLAGYFRH